MKTKQNALITLTLLVIAPSLFAWNIYLGATGGYNSIGIKQNFQSNYIKPTSIKNATNSGLPPEIRDSQFGASGGIGDVYFGITIPRYKWMLSLEGDASMNTNSAKNTFTYTPIYGPKQQTTTITQSIRNTYGISILPGYAISENNYIFLRAGVVYGEFNSQSSGDANNFGYNGNLNKYLLGYKAGIGLESYINKYLSIRVEYDYTQYQSLTESKKSSSPNFNYDSTIGFKPSSSSALLGLTFHLPFGGDRDSKIHKTSKNKNAMLLPSSMNPGSPESAVNSNKLSNINNF